MEHVKGGPNVWAYVALRMERLEIYCAALLDNWTWAQGHASQVPETQRLLMPVIEKRRYFHAVYRKAHKEKVVEGWEERGQVVRVTRARCAVSIQNIYR